MQSLPILIHRPLFKKPLPFVGLAQSATMRSKAALPTVGILAMKNGRTAMRPYIRISVAPPVSANLTQTTLLAAS